MRRQRRGSTLGSVMLVLTIALTLVLTSASVGIFNLRFSTAVDAKDHARNLAESAIFQAMAQVTDSANEQFGTVRPGSTVQVALDGLPAGSRGVSTFDPIQANNLRCRWSTNNLAGTDVASGDGRQVPKNGLHLVGLGICGDTRCQMELLLYRPAYPRALVSTGRMTLDAVRLSALLPGQPFDPATMNDSEGDATLFANAPGANALTLDATTQIGGSIGAAGGIILLPGARVSGEVRANAGPEPVPGLDVAEIVNRIQGQSGLDDFIPSSPLKSFAFLDNPGTVARVNLEGGVLAVRGALTVAGPVTGYGALVVDGPVTIQQGTSLSSNFAALMASGDIDLSAASRNGNYFQGLIYSRGSIRAHDITVIGSMVAKGAGAGAGNIDLDDMTFIQASGPIRGGIATPIAVDLGSGDDSAVIQLAGRIRPDSLTDYEFFGYAWYSLSSLDEVTQMMETSEYEGALHGDRATVLAQLGELLNNDDQNYLSEVQDQVDAALDAISGTGSPTNVVSFNLNNLLTPGDTSRVLLLQEVEP